MNSYFTTNLRNIIDFHLIFYISQFSTQVEIKKKIDCKSFQKFYGNASDGVYFSKVASLQSTDHKSTIKNTSPYITFGICLKK